MLRQIRAADDADYAEFEMRSLPLVSSLCQLKGPRYSVRREAACQITYKTHPLRGHYRMDFVCFESVVVEHKARFGTGPAEHAQVLSYLAATGHQGGLLLNFGSAKLEYRRFVLTKRR